MSVFKLVAWEPDVEDYIALFIFERTETSKAVDISTVSSCMIKSRSKIWLSYQLTKQGYFKIRQGKNYLKK